MITSPRSTVPPTTPLKSMLPAAPALRVRCCAKSTRPSSVLLKMMPPPDVTSVGLACVRSVGPLNVIEPVFEV